MQIRPITEADLPACTHIMVANPLWQRYGVTEDSAFQRLAAGLAQQADIWVAEEEQIVGFIWFARKGAFQRSGYVMLIGVAPDVQHVGLGAQLMNAAEQAMFETAKDIFLLVSDFNHGAQRFYQRRGYQQVGAIPDYVLSGVTEFIYRKVKP